MMFSPSIAQVLLLKISMCCYQVDFTFVRLFCFLCKIHPTSCISRTVQRHVYICSTCCHIFSIRYIHYPYVAHLPLCPRQIMSLQCTLLSYMYTMTRFNTDFGGGHILRGHLKREKLSFSILIVIGQTRIRYSDPPTVL